ncbi:hypothetical protein T484DRAFT_1782443 [Baffinella frigidus]|nr:hypothetical protein T484DRAFT_1782443 [Cryptophyta sp. CCMP2293]
MCDAFLVGLLVLASTVGTTLFDISSAAGRPPVFLLILTVVVVLASLVFATLAWKEKLRHQNFNMIFVALQICCYVTPVLEHFWGELDVFAYSYFLNFFMFMTICTSIYAVRSVKAMVFTSIFMSAVYAIE